MSTSEITLTDVFVNFEGLEDSASQVFVSEVVFVTGNTAIYYM